MKPSTKLILLVVVVILLFIAALVMGIYGNSKGTGGSPDAIKRDWLKALGGLSAIFAPEIDLKSLHCIEYAASGQPGQPAVRLQEQRVDEPFKLTDAHSTCAIDIPRNRKEKYRHAELKVDSTTATVYVHALFKERDFPQAERDKTKCVVEGMPLDAGRLETLDPFRLEISYAASGGEKPKNSWECWLKQEPDEPISVTVLEDGGRLTLTCRGCKSDPQRIVRMKME